MRFAWPLLLASVMACAPTASVAVRTRVDATVVIDPSPPKLPFDPRSARLVSASEQVAEIAGHPVQLVVDAAISPETRASYEDALIDAFESIGRDLDALRKRDEGAFAFGAPMVDKVVLRYDAAARGDRATLDSASRTFTITGPARRTAFVERGRLLYALMEAYEQTLDRKFATVRPEDVPARERKAYFDWIRRAFRDSGAGRDATTLGEAKGAEATLLALRLLPLVEADASISSDLVRYLLDRGQWFSSHYAHDAATVRGLPESSTFVRASRAWSAWAAATYPKLDADRRRALASTLFVRSFGDERARSHRAYPPFAWPGLDLFALGLGEIDRWRAAGHPTGRSSTAPDAAMEHLACPSAEEPDGRHVLAARCDHDFYRYALETPETRARLVRAITERADAKFTETVFRNVPAASERPLDATIVLLRELDRDGESARIGLRVLAETYGDGVDDPLLLDEARRVWVDHRDRRGSVLLLLAHMDRYGHGNVDWQGFADAFGAPVSADELSAFLDTSPIALSLTSVAWPAFGKGWSRAALLTPRLDAWLVDKRVPAYSFSDPYQALSKIIGQMCREKNVTDLALMRDWLERRAKSHVGEPYVALIERTREKDCVPAPPPPPPRSTVKLSPLKKGLPPLRIIQLGAE